jgi:hypothetical protein
MLHGVMKYSDMVGLDALYALIAGFAAPEDPGEARFEDAGVIASGLLDLGEDRSWASVWLAYRALHHEMSDQALARALEFLLRVDHPAEARAAALMLIAEITNTRAVYAQTDPSHGEQRALLAEAVTLAPDWPALRLRLARACKAVGADDEARAQARAARALLASPPTEDPFDTAITGRNFNRAYVERELETFGLAGPA